jgi:hypothetical protein
MKTFSQHINDDDDQLDEGFFRGASSVVLFSRIHDKSKKIKSTRNIQKKLDLVASQNTHLAALILATQFIPKEKEDT